MILTVTSSRGGANGSTNVFNFGMLVVQMLESGTEAGLEEAPATGVLLLFLAPNNFGVLVRGKFGHE